MLRKFFHNKRSHTSFSLGKYNSLSEEQQFVNYFTICHLYGTLPSLAVNSTVRETQLNWVDIDNPFIQIGACRSNFQALLMVFRWLASAGVFQNLIIIFPNRPHWDETRTLGILPHLLKHTDPLTLQPEGIWKQNKKVKNRWLELIVHYECTSLLGVLFWGAWCPNKLCSLVPLPLNTRPLQTTAYPVLAQILHRFAAILSGQCQALHSPAQHWATSIIQLDPLGVECGACAKVRLWY